MRSRRFLRSNLACAVCSEELRPACSIAPSSTERTSIARVRSVGKAGFSGT